MKITQTIKMNKTRLLMAGLGVLFIFNSPFVQAQMYKWVDAQGKVHFSDKPPPATAKQVQTKVESSSNSVSTTNLPADLAAAVKKNPVTLYTTATCAPCNSGRALLKQSGIPFNERTINTQDDVNKLKQVTGDNQLPVMVINQSKFKSFDATAWKEALNAAGYPDTNKLPKDYVYSEPEPAVKQAPKNNKESEDTSTKLSPVKETPSGIRF